MLLIKMLYIFAVPAVLAQSMPIKKNSEKKLFVCYGKVPTDSIRGYSLVILEGGHYNAADILQLKLYNTKLVAYLSVTEVNKNSSLYPDLQPYTGDGNPFWESSYIDLRQSEARQILLAHAQHLEKLGFDGLLLDTLDNAGPWGPLAHTKTAVYTLLKQIRYCWPGAYLIQNNGLYLEETGTDAILSESVISTYDFESNSYMLRRANDRQERLNQLKHVKKEVFLIEYANTLQGKSRIDRVLTDYNYAYFIGNITLNSIPIFKNQDDYD